MRSKLHVSIQALILAVLVSAVLPGCNRETSDDAIRNGQAALLAGDYPQAVKHLSRAAKLNPENAIVLYNLGMAQLMTADYKAAARSFDASDRWDVDGNTEALEGLALARREAGDYEGAISAFERAFAKVSRKPHLVAGMAVCEMEQGNMEYAKRILEDALITDPNDPRSFQGATVGTFAQLVYGSNTLANRQLVVDNQLLDDGIIDTTGFTPATLEATPWALAASGIGTSFDLTGTGNCI